MLYLSENIRENRRRLDMTQEDVAQALNVAPQTVSKWERAETYPDITLLPGLAQLFSTSVDALLGMDRLYDQTRYGAVYTEARGHLHSGDWPGAMAVYQNALKLWPGDGGLLTDLAMALALDGRLPEAASLCERALQGEASVKTKHTARAALCYIYEKMGQREKALYTAGQLPHRRESREAIWEQLQRSLNSKELDALIYELSTGEKQPKV